MIRTDEELVYIPFAVKIIITFMISFIMCETKKRKEKSNQLIIIKKNTQPLTVKNRESRVNN